MTDIKAMNSKEVLKLKFDLVSAGVDEGHQTHHCDDCGNVFPPVEEDDCPEYTQTCSHTERLTLCRKCYLKRRNGVR